MSSKSMSARLLLKLSQHMIILLEKLLMRKIVVAGRKRVLERRSVELDLAVPADSVALRPTVREKKAKLQMILNLILKLKKSLKSQDLRSLQIGSIRKIYSSQSRN